MSAVADLTPAQQLGRRIRAERATRGWSMRQVAIKAGLGVMTVMRAEHGREIAFSSAARIAAALDVPLDSRAAGGGTP